MNNNQIKTIQQLPVWRSFVKQNNLPKEQADQFIHYMELLLFWNEKSNLTAITDPEAIINFHFQDSLMLAHMIDFSKGSTIADVGAGAGFPGIPLKIVYPQLKLILIEVNQKKIAFLEKVIDELYLTETEVFPYDWRTFLRKTSLPVDTFVARASLQPEELLRMFKPGCLYNKATLVYWASQQWKPSLEVKPFIKDEYSYKIKSKKRKLILMKKAS